MYQVSWDKLHKEQNVKATFDITAIAMLIWIGIGKILIPLFVPPIIVPPIPEVSRMMSDASTGITNASTEIETLQAEMDSQRKSLQELKNSYLDSLKRFDESVKKLDGCDNAVTKLVEKDVHNDNRFSALENDVAVLQEKMKDDPEILKKWESNLKEIKSIPKVPLDAYEVAVQEAESTKRKVLFILSRTECEACERLENNVTTQPAFIDGVKSRFVLTHINVSMDKDAASHFTCKIFPAALVYDPVSKTWQTIGVPTVVNGMFYTLPPQNVSAFLSLLK